MKSIFKNIPVLLVVVLACLLLVLYKASQYLNQQQEKARIQATITDPEDSTLNHYYHPVADSLSGETAENQGTKFVDEDPSNQTKVVAEPEENAIHSAVPPTKHTEPTTPKAEPKVATPIKKTPPPPATPKQVVKKEVKTAENPSKATSSKAEDTGFYYVIAGSFGNKSNATAKLKEVKDKGFSNAKLVTFKSLKLISVSLRTYPTEAQANAYAKQVKEKYDIATIVKRGTKKVK